jgi:hypothetical protein
MVCISNYLEIRDLNFSNKIKSVTFFNDSCEYLKVFLILAKELKLTEYGGCIFTVKWSSREIYKLERIVDS